MERYAPVNLWLFENGNKIHLMNPAVVTQRADYGSDTDPGRKKMTPQKLKPAASETKNYQVACWGDLSNDLSL